MNRMVAMIAEGQLRSVVDLANVLDDDLEIVRVADLALGSSLGKGSSGPAFTKEVIDMGLCRVWVR